MLNLLHERRISVTQFFVIKKLCQDFKIKLRNYHGLLMVNAMIKNVIILIEMLHETLFVID